MNGRIKKYIVGIGLCLTILFSIVGCEKKIEFKAESLTDFKDKHQVTHKFSEQDASAPVVVKHNNVKKFQKYLNNLEIDYGYEELFDIEKTLKGMYSNHEVESHTYNIMDGQTTLTKEHLFDIVRRNNHDYMQDEPYGKLDIEDDEYLMRVCEIIVDTVNDLLKQYPDIDKDRVYCNLGYLKILEKTGALDYAAVESDLVLHMSPTMSKLADMTEDANMYSTLTHETMHILQIGCQCEEIEGCDRRAGMSYSFPEWEQNYADCVWLVEASAERMTCVYNKVEPMTYINRVRYLMSMELATMLQEDIPANYVATLSFYGDADRLFRAFGCENNKDKREIARMLYALDMSHTQESRVTDAYEKHYGRKLEAEEQEDFRLTIKRPIVQTFTKIFYRNLAQALTQNNLTKNDLYFLMRLYENTLNSHLKFENIKQNEYNAEFLDWYQNIRQRFMNCVKNASLQEYEQYEPEADTMVVDASVTWLPEDKKEFLMEKYEETGCDFYITY